MTFVKTNKKKRKKLMKKILNIRSPKKETKRKKILYIIYLISHCGFVVINKNRSIYLSLLSIDTCIYQIFVNPLLALLPGLVGLISRCVSKHLGNTLNNSSYWVPNKTNANSHFLERPYGMFFES